MENIKKEDKVTNMLEKLFDDAKDPEKFVKNIPNLREELLELTKIDFSSEKEKEDFENLSSIMGNLLNGISIKESLNLPESLINTFYTVAYDKFESNKLEDALTIFHTLSIIDPHNYKINFGLAATLHNMKKFKEAARMYFYASLLQEENPMPLYHASDCYIQEDDYVSALVAIKLAKDKKNVSEKLLKRILFIENFLVEELEKHDNDK